MDTLPSWLSLMKGPQGHRGRHTGYDFDSSPNGLKRSPP